MGFYLVETYTTNTFRLQPLLAINFHFYVCTCLNQLGFNFSQSQSWCLWLCHHKLPIAFIYYSPVFGLFPPSQIQFTLTLFLLMPFQRLNTKEKYFSDTYLDSG